jgi:hypothetical protein
MVAAVRPFKMTALPASKPTPSMPTPPKLTPPKLTSPRAIHAG